MNSTTTDVRPVAEMPAGLFQSIRSHYRVGATQATGDQRLRIRYRFRGPVIVTPCNKHGQRHSEVILGQTSDVSLWGRSFVPKRLARASFVVAYIQFANMPRKRTVRMLCQVRHVHALENGQWRVGCAFRETLAAGGRSTQVNS